MLLLLLLDELLWLHLLMTLLLLLVLSRGPTLFFVHYLTIELGLIEFFDLCESIVLAIFLYYHVASCERLDELLQFFLKLNENLDFIFEYDLSYIHLIL